MHQNSETRRGFFETAGTTLGFFVLGCATTGSQGVGERAKNDHESEGAEVTPGEDLMQEHGVLERIVLVYEEASRRIESGLTLDANIVAAGAAIVRRFIEDYHEKLEEEFVFPRLEAAQREVDLVGTLRRQHEAGRRLTDEIAGRSKARADPELAHALRGFGRMYRPHAAREDTVLFPAFRDVVGRTSYRELGEEFEEREHRLFGEEGFREIVRQVADLERALGIDNLARFNPE